MESFILYPTFPAPPCLSSPNEASSGDSDLVERKEKNPLQRSTPEQTPFIVPEPDPSGIEEPSEPNFQYLKILNSALKLCHQWLLCLASHQFPILRIYLHMGTSSVGSNRLLLVCQAVGQQDEPLHYNCLWPEPLERNPTLHYIL